MLPCRLHVEPLRTKTVDATRVPWPYDAPVVAGGSDRQRIAVEIDARAEAVAILISVDSIVAEQVRLQGPVAASSGEHIHGSATGVGFLIVKRRPYHHGVAVRRDRESELVVRGAIVGDDVCLPTNGLRLVNLEHLRDLSANVGGNWRGGRCDGRCDGRGTGGQCEENPNHRTARSSHGRLLPWVEGRFGNWDD
jgi:hypothetical protein